MSTPEATAESTAAADAATEPPPIDVPAGVTLTPYVPWSGRTCWRVEGSRGALLVTQAPLMGPWTAWRPDAPPRPPPWPPAATATAC